MTRQRLGPFVFILLVVLYTVGLAGHLWVPTRALMEQLTPGFLWISGLIVLITGWEPREGGPVALWALATLVSTLVIEIIGVQTGLIFGTYHYTDVLGWGLGGVPFVIGWNWLLVVMGVGVAVRRWVPSWPWWPRALLVGVLCAAFDVVLEPVAIHQGYWVWADPVVPLQNYLAWGVIAAAAAAAGERLPRWPRSWIFPAAVGLQVLFFGALQVGWR